MNKVENIVSKGDIVRQERYFLFDTMFSKVVYYRGVGKQPNVWKELLTPRQYGIGFNFVPWGNVVEKGETNVKNPLLFVWKKQPLWINKLY